MLLMLELVFYNFKQTFGMYYYNYINCNVVSAMVVFRPSF